MHKFALSSNRISGDIPKVLKNSLNVTILDGNLFSCKYDKSDLPKYDPMRDIYSCGSNSYNLSYFIWLSLLSININHLDHISIS